MDAIQKLTLILMYKDVVLNSRCHVVVDDGNDGTWVVFLELCDSSKIHLRHDCDI